MVASWTITEFPLDKVWKIPQAAFPALNERKHVKEHHPLGEAPPVPSKTLPPGISVQL